LWCFGFRGGESEVTRGFSREREREAAFWFDGCGFKHKPFLLALLIVGVPFNITILLFVLTMKINFKRKIMKKLEVNFPLVIVWKSRL